MAAILVIDPSETVRETMRIVLGSEHDVTLAPSWDDVRGGASPALVVLGMPPPPRDDHAAGGARARLAPDAALLLLHAPHEVDLSALAATGHPVAFLPKPFDGHMLRAEVRRLLAPAPRATPAPRTTARHRRWLESPLLRPEAAALARQAVLSDVPVLLTCERGSGALDVAQAIHFFAGGSGTIVMRSAPDIGDDLLPAGDLATCGALILTDVHRLPPHGQAALLAVLRGYDDAHSSARLFAVTDRDLEGATGFMPELVYALGVLPITFAPLRERTDDIPALVTTLADALAPRLRLEQVAFTDAALARLQRYLWFGNLAELETVLARTLAIHRPRVVEPEMLVFTAADAGRALSASHAGAHPSREAGGARPDATSAVATPQAPALWSGATAAPATAANVAAAASRGRVVHFERRRIEEPAADGVASGAEPQGADMAGGPSLEVLLGELAHELRNPMVTIKTFAQHLDSVLEDPEVRARFATLTGEAITRMDTLLETLLDFARFRAPLPQPIDLAALLARALDERADALARRHVRIERDGARVVRVRGDEAQMLFALRSLVDGVARDLVAHTPLRVATRADGTLELTVRADRAVAARLATYVSGAEADAGTPPLPIALAAALVRRNGGRLEARANGDGTTVITLTLPRAPGDEER